MAEVAQKAESCHQELIKRLDKSELRLVLRIIDAKDKIAEAQSLDRFLWPGGCPKSWSTT